MSTDNQPATRTSGKSWFSPAAIWFLPGMARASVETVPPCAVVHRKVAVAVLKVGLINATPVVGISEGLNWRGRLNVAASPTPDMNKTEKQAKIHFIGGQG